MNAKAWLTHFSLVLLLLPFSIVHALDKVTLQLRWYDQFQFAGYYMAKEKGFYEQNGIKVKIKQAQANWRVIFCVAHGEESFRFFNKQLNLALTEAHGVGPFATRAIAPTH